MNAINLVVFLACLAFLAFLAFPAVCQTRKKIDAVAADLAAHRADTEGHRVGYQVSESSD